MKVRYNGPEAEINESGEVDGREWSITLPKGKWVNVPDDHPRAAKLKGNPTYEIQGEDKPQLDHDQDGAAGGSLTKAEIVERLTDMGVEFDGRAKRDDLAALLADKTAQQD